MIRNKIGRHTPIENKCIDISQQAGSKRKSVLEFKNIFCAIQHIFPKYKIIDLLPHADNYESFNSVTECNDFARCFV